MKKFVKLIEKYQISNEKEFLELIKKYQLNENDFGSVYIQLIILEIKIFLIRLHLDKNKKDVPSKRSLIKKMAKRKNHINYLKDKKKNVEVADKLTKEIYNFFYKGKKINKIIL